MNIRNKYNAEITQLFEENIGEIRAIHQNQQCVTNDFAKKISDERDEIKLKYQHETSVFLQPIIWARQCFKYKVDIWNPSKILDCLTDPNPKFDDLLSSKNPEEIMYSSFKTSGKDLVLEGNDIGKAVEVWNHLKDSYDVYPENILEKDMYKCVLERVDDNDYHSAFDMCKEDVAQNTEF
ncbi:MAG: hypothetical protein ACI8ZF_001039 [Candidatus Midichloriaceae bacterium]|jgi:hypothetical protein